MKKQYKFDCSCKVCMDNITVFAKDEHEAEKLAKEHYENYIDNDSELYIEGDVDAYCDDSDGTQWCWTAQEQWDIDRAYVNAMEAQSHRGEIVYYISDSSCGYLLIFFEKNDSLYVAAVRGEQADIDAELLDKVFDVDNEEHYEFIARHEYMDVDWDDEEERGYYSYEIATEYTDDVLMPLWFEELRTNELRPFKEMEVEATKVVTESLRSKFQSVFPEVPFATLDKAIDDAVSWAQDNHVTEDLSLTVSAECELNTRSNYYRMWKTVNELKTGDIITMCIRGNNGEGPKHIMAQFRDTVDWQEADYNSMKGTLNVREAKDLDYLNADMFHTYKSDDIISVNLLNRASDANRIKELEYQINNIKAALQ